MEISTERWDRCRGRGLSTDGKNELNQNRYFSGTLQGSAGGTGRSVEAFEETERASKVEPSVDR